MMQHKAHTKTLRTDGFTFKQFFVAHDRCAMKVGTDGVLLGAWANITNVQKILDIGSGSGLIALMLAQRTHHDTVLHCVELDKDAAEQSQQNIAASPWSNRITLWHEDIQHTAMRLPAIFDLIVSNPPYFSPASSCRDPAREKARYTASLTHSSLLQHANTLLSPTGTLCIVLPYSAAQTLISLAENQNWWLDKQLIVQDNPEHPPHRTLLALRKQPCTSQTDYLCIKNSDRSYSAEFRKLMQAFYLFF